MAGPSPWKKWAHADFDGAAKCSQPGRKAVDCHALHPAAENLGKGWLVGGANLRGRELGESATRDGFGNGIDERTLCFEFSCFSADEAHIGIDIPAAAM